MIPSVLKIGAKPNSMSKTSQTKAWLAEYLNEKKKKIEMLTTPDFAPLEQKLKQLTTFSLQTNIIAKFLYSLLIRNNYQTDLFPTHRCAKLQILEAHLKLRG